jgi:archaellum component FlaG (FlaF/FlaG flagellin family)
MLKGRRTVLNRNKKAFGGAVSTMIMFIAVVSVTTGLVIAFMNFVDSTEQSFSTQTELSSNKLRTSMSISNIVYNDTSNQVYVYVKNVGETQLNTRFFDFYVDDQFLEDFDVYYAGNWSRPMTLFKPQDTLVVIGNITLGSGTHDVLVKSEFGVGDKDAFNI